MKATMTTLKTLNTQAIRVDGGTQARVQINNDAVADYAEAIKDGAEFPPVVVFFDGADYFLADGYHRLHASNTAGKTSIQADVRVGTLRDAVLYSLGANATHGLRPSSDDKRKSVATMLADAEWSQLSIRSIAKHCGCSHTLVIRMKSPEPVTPAAAKPATASGISSTSKPQSGTNSTQDAPVLTEKQLAAQQNAADAHGDVDTVAMWEAAEKQVVILQKELAAARADDPKAEILKWKHVADIATRRQNELMETVNAREKDLQKQANWLRRIGNAMGETDYSKLAAKVEAMARAARVPA